MSRRTPFSSHRLLLSGLTALGLFSVVIVIYTQRLHFSLLDNHVSFVRLLAVVDYEVTAAHLWLEEAIAGDNSIDLERDVRARLQKARTLVNTGLSGGDSIAGTVTPIPETSEKLRALRDGIESLSEMLESRWQNREASGIAGGGQDKSFDGVFADILLASGEISDQIDDIITTDRVRIIAFNAALVVLIGALFALVADQIMRAHRERTKRAPLVERMVAARTAKLAEREAAARRESRAYARAREQALAADGMKRDLIAETSRNLRPPINTVVGSATLLLGTDVTEDQRHCIEIVKNSGRSLLELADLLSEFSDIEAGNIAIAPVECSLPRFLEDIVAQLREEAECTGSRLSYHIADDVPETVRIDPARTSQALSTLLHMALELPENASITISSELDDSAATDTDEVQLRFSVETRHAGLDSQDSQDTAVAATQGRDSRIAHGSGASLNLAITMELAALMGGSMGILDGANGASNFWFTVRAKKAASNTRRGKANRSAAIFRTAAAGPRVLLVDGNQVGLIVTRSMLDQLGYAVDTATNGIDAIEACKRRKYAAILIDDQLPGMSAHNTASSIHALVASEERTPILMLSSNTVEGEPDDTGETGIDCVLGKPMLLEDLRTTLHSLLKSGSVAANAKPNADTGNEAAAPSSMAFDAGVVKQLRGLMNDGRTDLFEKLASRFLVLMPESLRRLEQAARDDDTELVSRHVQKLLGVCRQIGAQRMASACRQVLTSANESSGEDGDLLDKVLVLQREFAAAQLEIDYRWLAHH